jgi:ABC-2 type transport system permease protein
MNHLRSLVSAGIRNNFSSRSVAFIWYGVSLLLTAGLAVLFGILLISPELEKTAPDISKLQIYLGVTLFSASIIGLGVNLNALGFTSMIREKARGNIQSLLATNLDIRQIWLAKTLSVFIPGFIAGTVFTLGTLLAVNLIYFVPAVGFLADPWILLISLIIYPAMYFCLGLLVYQVGLINKPVTANMIAQVFLPLFINLVIQVMLRSSIMDYTSWQFMLANMGFAVIIGVIVVILAPRISREKIVLSY